MIGLTSLSKEAINRAVDDIFDGIALHLIGDIPKLRHRKLLAISHQPHFSLANLFVQSMSNKTPNSIEADALKSMLESAHGYIDSLKSRTRANITERIDGLVKEAKIKKIKVNELAIQDIIQEEMRKAKAHMKLIAEDQSTKLRNAGSMMQISRVASSIGDSDPSVFFVIVRDGQTCKECLRLHVLADGTPKIWKFSELIQSYHKRGDTRPSAFGEHPHCRCTLTYLSQGFGFKNGRLAYIAQDHNEFNKQRK